MEMEPFCLLGIGVRRVGILLFHRLILFGCRKLAFSIGLCRVRFFLWGCKRRNLLLGSSNFIRFSDSIADHLEAEVDHPRVSRDDDE